MADQLSDLLHRSVDDISVPHPEALDIIGRGRRLRRRRRVTTGAVAAAAIIAVGVGGVLVTDPGSDDPRGSDVAGQERAQDQDGPAQQAYDEQGAWVVDREATIGRTTTTLEAAPRYLAQTSAGIVAEIGNGQDETSFVLVRQDGTQEPLSIPADVRHVDGDLNAPHVAWLEPVGDALEVHVWDVEEDREVGTTRQPSQGTSAGDEDALLRVVLLDGDRAYFDAGNNIAFQVNWRTGAATAMDRLPSSVHDDIATVMDGRGSTIKDMATGDVIRRLDDTFENPLISPDGRQVLLIDPNGAVPVVSVEPVAGGTSVQLTDAQYVSVWTRSGNVLSAVAGGVQICDTAGTCNVRPVADGGLVLLADFLNLG